MFMYGEKKIYVDLLLDGPPTAWERGALLVVGARLLSLGTSADELTLLVINSESGESKIVWPSNAQSLADIAVDDDNDPRRLTAPCWGVDSWLNIWGMSLVHCKPVSTNSLQQVMRNYQLTWTSLERVKGVEVRESVDKKESVTFEDVEDWAIFSGVYTYGSCEIVLINLHNQYHII